MLFEIPIIVAMLYSIPEGFFIVMVGLKLFHIDIEWKRATIISIIYGFLSYLIRKSVFIYGLHTFFSIIVLTLLMKVIGRIPLFPSIIANLVALLLMGVSQAITVPAVLEIVNIPFSHFSESSALMLIAGIPTFILMGIICFVLHKTGFYLYNINLSKKE